MYSPLGETEKSEAFGGVSRTVKKKGGMKEKRKKRRKERRKPKKR